MGRVFTIFAFMSPNDERVDAYRNQLNPELQARFDELRTILRQLIPEAEESWSYSIPALRLNKRILLNFAVWKTHCGLYPGAAVNAQLQAEFKELRYSKGTCLLPHDTELPVGVIKRAVELGVERIKK